MKTKIVLSSQELVNRAIEVLKHVGFEPVHEFTLSEYKTTRNKEQNACMWATLTDISDHVGWHGQRLTKEEWKDVLSAALKRQKVVPGIDGGFVVIGAHTSKMSVSEMSELIELAIAFGAQQGVKFKAPAWMED